MKFIPYSLPQIDDADIASVVNVLKSGWITTGPIAKKFEEDFAEFLGGGVDCVAVNSATSGLHLALEALGIGPGDEVITTTHTFTATAEVIRYLGADPVFIDIDDDTLCIDLSKIENVITPRTKAIIPVHFGGLSVDLQALSIIAKKNNLFVVEDAAHALPTTCYGKLIGTHDSDAVVFSFYANKTMTTAEGGMLVTKSTKVANRARVMRLHGISRDAFGRYQSITPSWHYEIIAAGYKYNLTDVAAALGVEQLKKVYRFQERRQEISNRYNDAFSGLSLILPPQPKGIDVHSWHLYPLRLSSSCGLTRDNFIKKLFEKGIGCSVHYIPLHLHPYWKETYKLSPDMFPKSQAAYEQTVSLPIYSALNDNSVDYICESVCAIMT